jgi:serine/threonine protein kinase
MVNPEAATGQASAPQGRIVSFGRYLLLQRVSVGGMAEVFKALPENATRVDQILAIKRILPNIAEDHEFIGMFVDEARLVGQLTHPNICRIYELGRVGADHYIAMQFLWGRDLLKVMNRYKRAGLLVPEPMAVLVASQACAALHYAHTKCDASGAPLHIIHRDVSPQNIIVGYGGQSKLIDFGVARAATQSQKTQAGILKGKFGYMSPEMIRGLPVDHRSDVFAMGICLHEALSGSRLFYGETDFATLELVRDARVVPPSAKVPTIHPQLDAIVMRALARDADRRYQSAQELEASLLAFLAENYPGYGEPEVGASMREAFGHELAREKLRLDAFARMLERSELVRGALLPALPHETLPSGERAAPDEAPAHTSDRPSRPVLSGSREESQPPPDEQPWVGAQEARPELREEQTHIFFSAAELSEIRQLDQPFDAELAHWWTGPHAVEPAPSHPKLTPSGTYPRRSDSGSARADSRLAGGTARPDSRLAAGTARPDSRLAAGTARPDSRLAAGTARFDEQGRSAPALRGRDEHSNPTRALRESETAARAHYRVQRGGRGLARASLLALAALALAVFGYGAVRLGANRTATLEIGPVEEPDALVRVDGIVRGNPPLIVDDLAPGTHTLELEARGVGIARASIRVEAGETRAVDLMLSPRVESAQLTTPSIEPGSAPQEAGELGEAATVGKPAPRVRGLAPASKPARAPAADDDQGEPAAPESDAPAGGEALTARAEGATEPAAPSAAAEPSTAAEPSAAAEPSSDDEAPEPSERLGNDAVNAEAAAAGQGELLISTEPWSRVIIDGNDTGRDTPVRALRVAVGPHRVLLRTPDGPQHEISVMVLPGKTIRIIHRFPEAL